MSPSQRRKKKAQHNLEKEMRKSGMRMMYLNVESRRKAIARIMGKKQKVNIVFFLKSAVLK